MGSIEGDDRETWARPSEAQPPATGTDSPRAATPDRERAGFLARVWGRYGSEVRSAVLGRSAWDYLKQYTGGDAYWDNITTAQRECRTPAAARESVAGRTEQSPTPKPPR